jgi:APA family basic amino acid/polyamine antiporter
MLPVLFTYAGFQGTTYVTSEAVRPDRSIPRALLIGIGVVVVVYVLANVSYLRTLGPIELAASKVPAAEAMRAVLGDAGSKFIALAIALSTLGYLSTCMLILPRVYHQMAADGRFFKAVAWVSPKARVPAIAILLQAVISSAYAFSGTYEQIVNWVIAPMWLFIVIGASAVFVFRRRDAALGVAAPRIRSHPVVAAGFIAVLVAIFTSEFLIYPRDTLYGSIVVVSGVAAYYIRQYAMAWRAARPVASTNEP